MFQGPQDRGKTPGTVTCFILLIPTYFLSGKKKDPWEEAGAVVSRDGGLVGWAYLSRTFLMMEKMLTPGVFGCFPF